MLDELFKITGNKKGSRKAIEKLVNNIDITVNSMFLFNKFIIIGDAIAVGAIAVINTTWAKVKLKGFIKKKVVIGIVKFNSKMKT